MFKKLKKFDIIDSLFAHAKYSTDFQESEFIDWNRKDIGKELVFYTDSSLHLVNENVKNKIAWLLESPEITVGSYQWISKNNNKFDYVLTHQKNLLDRGENFIFCPTGGCWIKPEDQKIYNKSKLLSIIASPKRITHGQRLRHQIIDKYKNKIDLYGRGYNPIDYKLEALKDYMFSITIENTNKDYYFTEKLIDCFMTVTVPIYFGAPSIGNFFNEKGIIQINSLEDFEKIINTINKNKYQEMILYIKENFEKAKEYLIAEDYIYKNLIEKYGLIS